MAAVPLTLPGREVPLERLQAENGGLTLEIFLPHVLKPAGHSLTSQAFVMLRPERRGEADVGQSITAVLHGR